MSNLNESRRPSLRLILAFTFLTAIAVAMLLWIYPSRASSVRNPNQVVILGEGTTVPTVLPSQVFDVKGVDVTIDELKARGMTVYLPAVLPDKLKLTSIQIMSTTQQGYQDRDVLIAFSGWIDESQSQPSHVVLSQFEVPDIAVFSVDARQIIQMYDINGIQGVYYNSNPDPSQWFDVEQKQLRFRVDRIDVSLSGNVDVETLLIIAKSLKLT